MARKRFVVSVCFKTDVEASTDSEALALAASAIPYGFLKTRNTSLSIAAALPLETIPAEPAALPGRNQHGSSSKC
jgi:hypothetical protein